MIRKIVHYHCHLLMLSLNVSILSTNGIGNSINPRSLK